MRGPRSFRETPSDGLDTCNCAPLCWNAILMLLLSFLVGISSLFIMSTGGLVLGIIYCTIGCALGFVPFALHKTQARFWGIISILSLVLLMLLVIASVSYIIWLLVQSNRAQDDMSSSEGSPLVVDLLGKYAERARSSTARRLYEPGLSRPLDLEPLFDRGAVGAQGPAGDQPFPVLTGAGVETPTTTTSTSTSSTASGKHTQEQKDNKESGSATHQVEDPRSGEALTVAAPGERMKELVDIAKKKADKIFTGDESSFYPTVLRQSWQPTGNIFLSVEDVECLENINYDNGSLTKSESQLSALLDWGLFCGYTSYTISVLRKWPVSCSSDCNFDKLNLSKYRHSTKKTEEQVNEFMEALDSMTPEQVEVCTLLATVTTCRTSELGLDSAAVTAMWIALTVSLFLFCAAIKGVVDCVNFLKNENKTLAEGASNDLPAAQ
ncbi:hypothetical protein, conserved [Eimeria brunetti]|uniref:Transmembrane protein n=1 Tax=Eimeria brunetti TaxID=51314 RepID=U6LBR5_9EIME|nr:hypothetical protein, conserved [Eimeria brunetti]